MANGKGARNSNARLTAKQVQSIRKMYNSGRYTQQRLAKRFGVAQATICYAVRGKTWKHLKGKDK